MLKINVHLILRLAIGTVTAIASALAPQLAHAQAPGALAQLASPNNCIQVTNGGSPDCETTGPGLLGSEDVAVSPDGKNVYVVGNGDDAISEFSRDDDGVLTWEGCIADANDTDPTSCSDSKTGAGLINPDAIAISPDGNNVYVTGFDSEGNGDVAEFARAAGGMLIQMSPDNCIAERSDSSSDCHVHDVQHALGLKGPAGIAVSPDGLNVYVADENGNAITTFSRAADGVLSQPDDACITEHDDDNGDCTTFGNGLDNVDTVVVSADGDNVYAGTLSTDGNSGAIAEFSRASDGALSQLGNGHDCIQDGDGSSDCAEETGVGINNVISMAVSPDGQNLYSSTAGSHGAIAEFSRAHDGALAQLPGTNNCIEQLGSGLGCGAGDPGLDGAAEVKVSPDGANVYLATSTGGGCCDAAITEFGRSSTDGSLTQLPSPDNCIEESGDDTCGNHNGSGLGGGGLAIAPDGTSVYVTGENDIAEFARPEHTLTVALGGSGSGAVGDQTGEITCPTTCSHAYPASSQVTLTAAPTSGSTFSGWSGACSGAGSCQLTMSDDMQVTATFTAIAPPTVGAPTPVLTGAPSAVTDSAAGFQGSVNPDGLATTVYFQYGLDRRYSQPGASGPNYTQQTPPQSIGPDFSVHGIGPVAVSGLVPNALYHVRIVATNSAGTIFGPDITFTTATAPSPGAPTLGKTFNIAPVSGLVLVLVHGHLVPLTQLQQIGPGTTIDMRHGTLELITAGAGGAGAHDAAARRKQTQIGRFGGAVIRIRQTKFGPARGMTTVIVVEGAFKGAPSYALCEKGRKKKAGDASTAAVPSKVLQLLHASATGNFKTTGKYSAATVRGTKWTIADRCDGTRVHDITDSVAVTDFVRHKTIILHAGQSYLALAPRKKHP